MIDEAARAFPELVPDDLERCTLLLLREQKEELTVRRGVLEPWRELDDAGALVTVEHRGGRGYASTPDLSSAGLGRAIAAARRWAEATAALSMDAAPAATAPVSPAVGRHETAVGQAVVDVPLGDKIDLLRSLAERLKTDDRIVEWYASLWSVRRETALVGRGGEVARQDVHLLCPGLGVVADDGRESITRSLGDRGRCRQGGWEDLAATGALDRAERLPEEALALLAAPDCPTGVMDLVLAPDQMLLQIHESIGHPLELDRILGDERNYAGRSFVSLDMFGSYRYGSELLTAVFDPTLPEEMASYRWDDEGLAAERAVLIDGGTLVRPLGGALSAARAGRQDPVACARVTSWNRPAIDRMANLNVVPGETPLGELIAGVERGVMMETNTSWSIDDSRNKFQFGCELGRLIVDGELRGLVKKPNYRGISSSFWRSLSAVGDEATFEVVGTPFCGKGEPNQVIRVGHASPVCRFSGVEVFGGD